MMNDFLQNKAVDATYKVFRAMNPDDGKLHTIDLTKIEQISRVLLSSMEAVKWRCWWVYMPMGMVLGGAIASFVLTR
jgi:hypothetical protein